MSSTKSFTLQTEVMSDERLENYGLLWNDTKGASDHFPIVADFDLSFYEGCNIDGDINCDEEINVLDIVILVEFILEWSEPTEEQFLTSDLNSDGLLNILDIVILVNIILS